MKNILVPIDGSDYSTLAINKAKEIAKAFDSRIVLLHVMQLHYQANLNSFYALSPSLVNMLEKEGGEISSKILSDAKEKMTDFSGQVDTKLLKGSPADEILKFSEYNDVDLIIMGSGGMTLGSVTRKVALTVNKPLLIVKA